MTQQARDEVATRLGELVRRALLVERVHVALEQRHVRVHAAAGLSAQRLGHECGVDALLDRHLLDDGAERHDVVGRRQRVGVAQIDLVLAGPALVVAELDGDAEVLQHPDRAPAEIVGGAARDVVEVPGRVDRLGTLRSEGRGLQQVELDLGMRVEREARVGRLGERALEDVPWVGHGGLTVGRGDVAEHARRRVDLAAPRQDLERGGVGVREQVRLVGPRQTLDRGAVEPEPFAEGSLDLSRCDRHRLERADDVCEPEPDEFDAPLLDRSQNEVTLLVHRIPSGAGSLGPRASSRRSRACRETGNPPPARSATHSRAVPPRPRLATARG